MRIKTGTVLLFIIFLTTHLSIYSQNLTISTSGTPQTMVNSLIDGCTEISNVVYTGSPNSIATFSNGDSFGIPSGIILSTGNVSNAVGPNNGQATSTVMGMPGDSIFDLDFGCTSTDAAVLEFDFISYSNSVSFTYLFASEGYPELDTAAIADAIGIYVTGPSGGMIPYVNTNIAKVPGTTDTITNGTINSIINSTYYVDNTGGSFFEFDGYTIPMELSFAAVPCTSYHIRFVVADIDPAYDAALLIGAESLKSDFALNVQNYSTTGGLFDINEGCTNTLVILRQDLDTNVIPIALPFNIDISGTSTEGVDFTGISTGQYYIPSMETYLSLDYTAVLDGVPEGVETIIFTISHPSLCDSSCTAEYELVIDIIDNFPLVAGIVESDTGICSSTTTYVDLHTFIPPSTDPSTVYYLWSTGATDPWTTVNPPLGQQTEYCVTITDVCDQYIVDCIDITKSDFSGIQITTSDNLCFGDEFGAVQVLEDGGMPPFSYMWDAGGLGNDSTSNISTLPAGNFAVTVTDTIGCSYASSFAIHQPDSIYYNSAVFEPSCYGYPDGSLLFEMFNGVPPYSFEWSNGETTSSLDNIPAGTYEVTTSDQNGCSDVISIDVNQPEQLVLWASDDVYICLGQTVPLNASVTGGTPTYFYSWSDGSSGPFTSVTPATSTIYTVQVTDLNGCVSNIEEIAVNIYPPISVQLSTTNDSICNGEETSIYANIQGGTGGPYIAIFSDGASSEILPPPYHISPEYTTTYDILVNDFCNSPSGHYSLTINVFDPPDIEISSDIDKGCRPLKVNFEDLNYEDGNVYHWDYGDGTNELLSYTANPPHTFYNEGLYDISVEVTSVVGCKNTVTKEQMIDVYPIPSAKFYATPELVSIVKPIVYFDNTSNGASIYTWDFGDDSDTSNSINPEHAYRALGTYLINLTAENEFGCIDSASHTIRVRNEYTFYAPNVFSPNSQVPENRVFIPVGEGIDPNNFHMIIYNRWGDKIYETFDLNHPWDGKIAGKQADVGSSYPWVVIYKDFNGEQHQESGIVSVLK